jgi:hypothetical protein
MLGSFARIVDRANRATLPLRRAVRVQIIQRSSEKSADFVCHFHLRDPMASTNPPDSDYTGIL